MKETEKCIICGEKPKTYTGHVIKKKSGKHIIAGFCKEHEYIECPKFGGLMGCFGFYQKWMGIRKYQE